MTISSNTEFYRALGLDAACARCRYWRPINAEHSKGECRKVNLRVVARAGGDIEGEAYPVRGPMYACDDFEV